MNAIGFTGSRNGMHHAQAAYIMEALTRLSSVTKAVHHGDCLGADKQFHDMAIALEIPVIIHPPEDSIARAFCKGETYLLRPRPYLMRNSAIIEAADIMFAAPKEYREVQRSGTWSTIRKARKSGTPISVVFPDGTIQVDSP